MRLKFQKKRGRTARQPQAIGLGSWREDERKQARGLEIPQGSVTTARQQDSKAAWKLFLNERLSEQRRARVFPEQQFKTAGHQQAGRLGSLECATRQHGCRKASHDWREAKRRAGKDNDEADT